MLQNYYRVRLLHVCIATSWLSAHARCEKLIRREVICRHPRAVIISQVFTHMHVVGQILCLVYAVAIINI